MTKRGSVATAASWTVAAVLTVSPIGFPPRADTSQNAIRVVTARATEAPRTAGTIALATSWSIISRMITEAIRAAKDDGHPVSAAVADLAYGVAASLRGAAQMSPAVTDNELGGIVFYWKGASREIQIEIDGDSSHFVRVKGADGKISFLDEGFGQVPLDAVNQALSEWQAEKQQPGGVTLVQFRA